MNSSATPRGLTRVPYYPELRVFRDASDPEDLSDLVLSALLYWHALSEHHRFNSRKHTWQISRTLKAKPEQVTAALKHLTALGLLQTETVEFETQSDNPEKKRKTDVFVTLDFNALSAALKEHGYAVPVKVLRLAADDFFDLSAYISPEKLPVIQGLLGKCAGGEYERAAQAIAGIITGICADSSWEAFSHQALAPGWHMLVQPPCTAEDVVQRWLRQGERSVDLDLTDGSFFLPDADCFGETRHRIWHCGRHEEPRQLAAALYLTAQGCSESLHFFSDLSVKELSVPFELVKTFTGIEPRLDEAYFENLALSGADEEAARRAYAELRRA